MADPVILTSGFGTTDGTTFTTAQFTPSANKMLMLGLLGSAPSGGTTAPPSLSVDAGQTWDLTRQTPDPAAIRTAYAFRTFTGSSPAPRTLTLTFPTTVASVAWAVYEIDNVDVANPTVQSIEQRLTGNSNTSVNFSFTNPVDPANTVIAFVGIAQSVDIVPGTGWTAGAPTVKATSPANTLLPMHGAGLQNVLASWSTTTNTWVIAVEVKSAPGTPTGKLQKLKIGSADIDLVKVIGGADATKFYMGADQVWP